VNPRYFEVPVRFSSFFLLLAIVFFAPLVRSQAADASERDPQFRVHRSVEELKRDNERMKAMNKNRAQRIKRDTDKLLQLAIELKQYVDKTNENVLSVEVIKKAEEVEKLARNIREKMKEDYRIPDDVLHP
jgi:ATP-dependent helicase/DNAse subunit B